MTDKISKPESGDADPREIKYINLYESDKKIYTRKITGFYQRLRSYTGVPLILGYILMPWLIIDARPAMLFDLPERQFHILWMTFWPQDGQLLAFLLMIAAFALFTVTVLVGRVWCGFTCPQTVWTQIFISVEHLCQGDRNKRIKLDEQPLNLEKFLRKSVTHILWLFIALITALTFVGYFTPIRSLLLDLTRFEASYVSLFWVGLFTFGTYLNAGWMREQVCKYMCPYARFQSVMYDKDTLSVTYDHARGETRGPRKMNEDYKSQGKGDCIDCSWCVQVCPVDIDIRDGAQYECIDCGLCVDACNAVMDKVHYPRGLISFTSEDALKTGKLNVWRPRLLGYFVALAIMIAYFGYTIGARIPVDVDVVRDRGARLYRIKGDRVQNVYTIKINNMDRRAHVYDVTLKGELNFQLKGYRALGIEEGEVFTIPVRVSVLHSELTQVKTPIEIIVTARDDAAVSARHSSVFIGPKSKK